MSDTAVLPRTGYALRRDRCVVELSLRLLRIPLLRRRLTASEGRWTSGGPLTVALEPDLVFTADEVAEDPLVIDGHVAGREVRLRGDVRHRDERSVVVWAAGVALPAQRKPRRLRRTARFLAGRRLHVELAIEFAR